MIYYISDTHFNDQKIFDKSKRPFKSLDEMKETIIKKLPIDKYDIKLDKVIQ